MSKLNIKLNRFSFLCLFFICIFSNSASAQISDQNTVEIRQLSDRAQAIQEATFEFSRLFNSPEYDDLLDAIAAEQFDSAKRMHEIWSVSTETRLTELKSKMSAIPSAPYPISNEHRQMKIRLDDKQKLLFSGFEKSRMMLKKIDASIEKAINGETAGLAELRNVKISSLISGVENENQMILSNLEANGSAPQFEKSINKMVVELNSLTVGTLKIYMLANENRVSFLDRSAVVLNMESGLQRAISEKENALQQITIEQKQFNSQKLSFTNNELDKAYDRVDRIFENLLLSLENEEKIIDLFQQQIDILKMDDDYRTMENDVKRISGKIGMFSNHRMELERRRLAILQEI